MMGARELPPIDKTTWSLDALMTSKKKEKKSGNADSKEAEVKLVKMEKEVEEELIAEYFDVQDTNDTTKQLSAYIISDDFVEGLVATALDRGAERDCRMAGSLLIRLHTEKKVTVDIVAQGLLGCVALLPDLKMDVPFAPKFFARLLSELHMAKPPLVDGSLIQRVTTKASDEVESGLMATVAAEWLLHAQGQEKEGSDEFARVAYEGCLARLEGLLPKGKDRLEFLEQHGLERLDLGLLNRRELEKLFNDDNTPADVATWCTKAIGTEDEASSSPPVLVLCRSLMGCFLKYACGDGKTLATLPDDVEKYASALIKVLGRNLKRQLAVLLEVQLFCHDKMVKEDDVFPKQLINKLFMCLYDEDVVYEDAFMEWKDYTEVDNGVPGKMEALFALNKWLQWLQEAEEEESSEED